MSVVCGKSARSPQVSEALQLAGLVQRTHVEKIGCCAEMENLLWQLCGRPANDPQLMSYRSYLDSFLLPFRTGLGSEVERHNTDVKNKRQAFKRRFTEPGEPGHMFRHGPSRQICPRARQAFREHSDTPAACLLCQACDERLCKQP